MFLKNKYTTYYFNIIENAKLKDRQDDYYELHHILPKSLGGSNKKSNMVKLTAREHFICHWLLTKMVDTTNLKWKMTNALGLMMWSENKNQTRYKINSRLYESLKKKHSELKSWAQLGEKNGFYKKQHSEETKRIMSEKAKGRIPWNKGITYIGGGMTGKNHSLETREKISKHRSGITTPLEIRKKISAALLEKGITRSSETRAKMSESKKGVIHPRKICEQCGKEITVAMYARWHGKNCKS